SALPPHSVERSPTTLPVSSLILPFAWSHLPSVLSFIAHAPSKLRHTAGKTGAVTLSSYDDDRRDGARRPEHAIVARLSLGDGRVWAVRVAVHAPARLPRDRAADHVVPRARFVRAWAVEGRARARAEGRDPLTPDRGGARRARRRG